MAPSSQLLQRFLFLLRPFLGLYSFLLQACFNLVSFKTCFPLHAPSTPRWRLPSSSLYNVSCISFPRPPFLLNRCMFSLIKFTSRRSLSRFPLTLPPLFPMALSSRLSSIHFLYFPSRASIPSHSVHVFF